MRTQASAHQKACLKSDFCPPESRRSYTKLPILHSRLLQHYSHSSSVPENAEWVSLRDVMKAVIRTTAPKSHVESSSSHTPPAPHTGSPPADQNCTEGGQKLWFDQSYITPCWVLQVKSQLPWTWRVNCSLENIFSLLCLIPESIKCKVMSKSWRENILRRRENED